MKEGMYVFRKSRPMQVLTLIALGFTTWSIYSDAVRMQWFLIGIISWIIALLAKMFVFGLVQFMIEQQTNDNRVLSVAWGVQSAAAELGLTMLFFYLLWDDISLKHVWSFGLGIGVAELYYTLYMALSAGIKQLSVTEDEQPSFTHKFVEWSGVFERLYTLPGHVFSRLLIWLGCLYPSLFPLIFVAFILFALVDGVASYAGYQSWDFTDPVVSRRFHLAMCSVTLLEGALCWIFLSSL